MAASTDTEILPDDAAAVMRAAMLLRQGRLVAFPTETVYGLGGDACSTAAVAAIFVAKGRPQQNPLIVHLADLAAARRIAAFDDAALVVAAAFWPGPLTLVLPLIAGGGIAGAVTAGLGTIAVRVPAHPVAQALLAAFGGPLAAPSANPSGRVSPTSAAHVTDGLSGRIAAVIDGGICPVGVESTILDLTRPGLPLLLRPGGTPTEALEAILGQPLAQRAQGGTLTAPGQMASHYAPEAALRLNVTLPLAGEVWVGFGPGCGDAATSLSPTGDVAEAAARLFQALHTADALAGPGGRIAFAPVPETGLGQAVNDRLRRAAAPRGSQDQGLDG